MIPFLKWLPDLEDYNNPGMTVADNVLHDTDGYKQLLQQTALAFATVKAATSLQIKPAGVSGQNRIFAALVPFQTATSSSFLSIGDIDTADTFTQLSMGTLTSVGACRIQSFSIAELGPNILITAKADGDLLAGGTTTIALTGIASYSLV